MDFATGEYKFQAEDVRMLKTRTTDAKFAHNLHENDWLLRLRARSDKLKREFTDLSDLIVCSILSVDQRNAAYLGKATSSDNCKNATDCNLFNQVIVASL